MPPVNETGHTKNVSAFFSLIGYVKGWGTDYQPTNITLTVDNLEALHPVCEKAVIDAADEEKNFNDLVDKRIAAFKPLKPYATRIINSFATIDLPDETIAGAKEINRKIQGKRATLKKDETITPVEGEAAGKGKKSISTSQMSFDNNVKHVNDLRAWVQLQETYNPNEADLKVAAIKTYHDKLDAANKAVINGLVHYENKLDARDKLLYADKTGMVDIASAIKKYAISAFGASSAKYKQIAGLSFRKLPRKK